VFEHWGRFVFARRMWGASPAPHAPRSRFSRGHPERAVPLSECAPLIPSLRYAPVRSDRLGTAVRFSRVSPRISVDFYEFQQFLPILESCDKSLS
jgi:hypothetical protein